MPNFKFTARNFRKLHQLDWSPSGPCLLAGPNGAGKTTTLQMLRFLRTLFVRGHEAAFIAVDGDHFRARGAAPDDLVEFEVHVGELRWVLRLPMSDAGLKGTYGEELYRGDKLMLRAAAFADTWFIGAQVMPIDDTRCCAKVVWDAGSAPWMEPLVRLLTDLRVFEFWIEQVQDGTSREDRGTTLHGTGRNLWAVLAAWKQAPTRFHGQFDQVLHRARSAFPDLIDAIEFERGEGYIFPPGATDPQDGLPARRQANGLLTGLLQLTALAGAKPGSILAFDEVENQLHPHAIRSILAAMREEASKRDLTIILTTHSPVVLNAFRDEPEQVYVLDHGQAGIANPGRMSDLHSEEWLAQAKLGTLYERLAFGAPPGIGKPQ